MKLQWGGRGVWGKVGCFLFTPVQQLLPALPWRIGWTCQWDHLRKRSPLHVLLFCDSLTFRAVKLADLLLHASLSPSSVSYKTTVSALPTYDRGTATCCFMPSRQEKSKTDFSVDTVQHFQKCIGSRLVEKAEDYQKDYEDSHSAVMYPFSTKLLKVGHHTLSERYCDTCISSPTTYQYIPCSIEAKINKDINFPKILFVHFLLPTPSMRHA